MSNDHETDFLRFMSRHVVALTGEYESFTPDTTPLHRGVFVFSGWVLALHERWFWVTAGHCFKQCLDHPIQAGTMRIISSGFADYFGLDAAHQHLVPFTYEVGDGFYVDRGDMGLDFGLIPLSDLTRRAFAANGVVAVSRQNWVHQEAVTFTLYRMLGFPSQPVQESTVVASDGSISAYVQPVMIGIDRLEPNEVSGSPASTWFVGRIVPEATIPNIEGMSGGPVYGFRQGADGRWYYHVVALQSRWRPESRIVFGCSVPLFAEAVHQALLSAET